MACSPRACFRSPPRTAAWVVSVFGLRQPTGYSDEDVQYLSLLTDHVALSVDIALRDEEQRHVEEELRKQKAHFEKLFELAPEAIVLRDAENRVLRANREFAKLFRLQHRGIGGAGISAT